MATDTYASHRIILPSEISQDTVVTATSLDHYPNMMGVKFSREIRGQQYAYQTYIDSSDSSNMQHAMSYHYRYFDDSCTTASGGTYTTTSSTYTTGTPYIYIGNESVVYAGTNNTWTWPNYRLDYSWSTWDGDSWYVAYPSGLTPENRTHAEKMQYEINRLWDRFLEEERQAEKIIAESKAEDLMSILIGEKEFVKYKETGKAYVRGKNGLYLVKKGGGISQIKDNKITDFCIHIDHIHKCPPTDHAIALKLMLEDDDSNVIRLANRLGTKKVDQLPMAACM